MFQTVPVLYSSDVVTSKTRQSCYSIWTNRTWYTVECGDKYIFWRQVNVGVFGRDMAQSPNSTTTKQLHPRESMILGNIWPGSPVPGGTFDRGHLSPGGHLTGVAHIYPKQLISIGLCLSRAAVTRCEAWMDCQCLCEFMFFSRTELPSWWTESDPGSTMWLTISPELCASCNPFEWCCKEPE